MRLPGSLGELLSPQGFPNLKPRAPSWGSAAGGPGCQVSPVWATLRRGHCSGAAISPDFGARWSLNFISTIYVLQTSYLTSTPYLICKMEIITLPPSSGGWGSRDVGTE